MINLILIHSIYFFWNSLMILLISPEKTILWINEKREYDTHTGKLLKLQKLIDMELRVIMFKSTCIEIITKLNKKIF